MAKRYQIHWQQSMGRLSKKQEGPEIELVAYSGR
jgi:hypothetical protein